MNEIKKVENSPILEKVEALVAQSNELQKAENNFLKAFQTANIVGELRQLIAKPEILETLKRFQNSALGFMCDKPSARDNKPYPDDVIVNAITEAILLGVNVNGNEFNIISNRCYITKNGMKRMLNNLNYITDVQIKFGAIKEMPNNFEVETEISWFDTRGEGKSHKEKNSFLTSKNSFSTADNTLGKALRKARAWLYETATGNNVNEGEAADYIDISASQQNVSRETSAKVVDTPQLKTEGEKKPVTKKTLQSADKKAWDGAVEYIFKKVSENSPLETEIENITKHREISAEDLELLKETVLDLAMGAAENTNTEPVGNDFL